MGTKDKLVPHWKDPSDEITIKIEKPEFASEEIIRDSEEDASEVEVETPEFTPKCLRPNKKFLRRFARLKGLIPTKKEGLQKSEVELPIIKRCCIEHCYFSRNYSQLEMSHSEEKSASDASTLKFANENSNEQQTIDTEQEGNSNAVSNFINGKNVEDNEKNQSRSLSIKSGRSSRSSNSSGSSVVSVESSDSESTPDDPNDRDYIPQDNSTDSENASVKSKTSCNLGKKAWKPECSNTKTENVGKFSEKISYQRLGNPSCSKKSEVSKDFVSVRDLYSKIRNMQKLMRIRSDKKFISEYEKNGKQQSRLKKMRHGEYSFPATKDKNWRVEYMDDQVQSLGLDDLLLKASELNAENFTKALGRKLEPSKPNFGDKESSGIVFTIPESNKEDNQNHENVDNDFSKVSKTVKLDISKPFFEPSKVNETELLQEASSKRPGIKVKTVENINEEFKDSLGLKKNVFIDCGRNGLDKDASSNLEDRRAFNDATVSQKIEKEENTLLLENNETGEPFVMTIIQSKAEKQRPAILRNSYLKKKATILEKAKTGENAGDPKNEVTGGKTSEIVHDESTRKDSNPQHEKSQVIEEISLNNNDDSFKRSPFGNNVDSCSKIAEKGEDSVSRNEIEKRFTFRKRNIPFILNHNRKVKQAELPLRVNTITKPSLPVSSQLVKLSDEKSLRVRSIEQNLRPRDANVRFVKVVPYEPINKSTKTMDLPRGSETTSKSTKNVSDKIPTLDGKMGNLLSLAAFTTILRDILPDRWLLCLDKKYGLQIIKTQMDELLNPSMLISVVIGMCGKLTVNVRGRQLKKSHELFNNLCDITNSENKLSLNYVLAILNKLKFLSVCFGCDDPSLQKYWCGEGSVEHHTEFHQVYRSSLCNLLVSLGKKRCYPCYRLNESIKKRQRREKLEEKYKEFPDKNTKEVTIDLEADAQPKMRGVKRNLEDFLKESFSTMKEQIVHEIERSKKLGEKENAMRAQEEVLSFMGLARKDSLENSVRKSKRKRNSFFKFQQPVKKKVDQQELEFLEKHWADINTLFSTSLLFGAYSRTGGRRLREKCKMFCELLSKWKNIVRNNPEWTGGEISLPNEHTDDESSGKDLDQFEKMDVPALRAYIINSVKEVNRIKHKLRTQNSYFKVLYNKFVRRRMKRPKPAKKGNGSSANSTTNTPTPTDFSSDESSRDKEKGTDEDNQPISSLVTNCPSGESEIIQE